MRSKHHRCPHLNICFPLYVTTTCTPSEAVLGGHPAGGYGIARVGLVRFRKRKPSPLLAMEKDEEGETAEEKRDEFYK